MPRILKGLQQHGNLIDVVVRSHGGLGLIGLIAISTGPAGPYAVRLFDVLADWILQEKTQRKPRFVVCWA